MSELHLLPCFSASVESTKKTRRPWLWAMGTCKRPSVAMHRSPVAFSSTLSGSAKLPQLCYEERQETILSAVSLSVKWKRMCPSPKWAMKLRGSFSKNSCSRALVLRAFPSSTALHWLWE
ncbi:hypothetical protein LEMLEM_LOCUS9852 [Lemmus lemmus]